MCTAFVFLLLCILSPKRGIGKQCRPWSDAAERGVWSGSTLFASNTRILPKKKKKKKKMEIIENNQTPLLLGIDRSKAIYFCEVMCRIISEKKKEQKKNKKKNKTKQKQKKWVHLNCNVTKWQIIMPSDCTNNLINLFCQWNPSILKGSRTINSDSRKQQRIKE